MLVCGLFCGFFIYRQGVKDGMGMKDGIKPKLPNPVAYVNEIKEAKQTKEAEEEMSSAFDNLMSYNGDKQKVGE